MQFNIVFELSVKLLCLAIWFHSQPKPKVVIVSHCFGFIYAYLLQRRAHGPVQHGQLSNASFIPNDVLWNEHYMQVLFFIFDVPVNMTNNICPRLPENYIWPACDDLDKIYCLVRYRAESLFDVKGRTNKVISPKHINFVLTFGLRPYTKFEVT